MSSSSSSVPAPSTLVALLRSRAEAEPDRLAYVFLQDGETESGQFTYAQLDARARTIAARLQTTAAPGDRALLLYPPGLEFLAAFFGCLYAGVIAVPSYPPKRNRPDPRLQSIAIDAGARLVLTDAAVHAELEPRLTHTPELRALTWIATDALPTTEAAKWREPAIDGRQLAFLQYTSGSTSTPKGVMVSHGNLLHNLDDLDRGWEHTRDSVMVTWLPIFHDMGLIYGALMPLFKGFKCVMLPPPAFLQRPSRWLEAITRYCGTHSAAPNFAYDLCVASTTAAQRAAFDLRSWHFSLNAAEPVRAETLAAFNAAFGPCGLSPLTVSPGFGLAEATLKVAALPRAEPTTLTYVRSDELAQHRVITGEPGAAGVQPIVGCGWGQADNRYLIVDPETCTPCAEDRVGEIWFAGPSVAQGYWNRPAETAATFQARLANGEGPFMRTGDLGFVRGREVYVTGRVKDMIIIRGLNHYPQDIELTVEKCHAALRPSCGAAFSVDLDGHEALVIAQEIERTHLRKLNVDEVVAAIRKAVAEQHELPVSAIALLRTGSIPKTSSGKIMRRACRLQFTHGQFEIVGEWRLPSAPPTDAATAAAPMADSLQAAVIESWLATQLAQKLNVAPTQIDARESFSRYGLDSLAAVELSGGLERWLGRRLSPTLLYDYPSIHALATFLADPAGAGSATSSGGAASGETKAGTTSVPSAAGSIAIVGLGCRLPGADSPAEFWDLLAQGRDAITRVPAGRWDPALADAPAWGGFLREVDGFDADFFGIAPREADLMDPQQRLLLEVAYEALEDAGIVPKSLGGSRTGVFVGISTNDYGRLLARVAAGTDAHAGTGNALSIAANRISYLLDLRGPSVVLDTACSSSLVALHHAVRSLRAGESDVALVGGVNLILAPELTTTFARAGMLAPDGRCKTFDAAADGYVRGEGCGVVVLKRLADAERDGDRVLALVHGTAVNQDGRSNGLTAPNGPAQQAVVRAALRDAALTPADISYVEAHGTGTTLGDPIEANSLRDVLLENRTPQQPCWIGSVKTNIGHLEAAAGIAGLIKVVLALRHRQLPPHLHLRSVNPLMRLAGTSLAIPTVLTPWPQAAARDGRAFAGVSSFGFGGTNAHVIIGGAPLATANDQAAVRPEHVLVLSARSLPALRTLASRYADRLANAQAKEWTHLCHSALMRRGAYAHRLAVVRPALDALHRFAREGLATEAALWSGEATEPPRVAFLFSGTESLRAGVGRDLYRSQPAFRAAVEECRAVIAQRAGWDLVETVQAEEEMLSDEFTHAALFTFQIALARAWQAFGVEPAGVVGDGVGEYAAAVVAGALTLEDALSLVIARARLMTAHPPGDALNADFGAIVADTKLGVPAKTFISTATGTELSSELARSEYWIRHLRLPTRLPDAMQTLHATGIGLAIEIGVGDTLVAAGAQTWPDRSAQWLPSVAVGRTEWSQLLASVARAYVRGVPVRWPEVDRGLTFESVELPHYPFQRQRHWFEDTPIADTEARFRSLAAKLETDPTLSAAERAAVPGILAALERAEAGTGAVAGLTYVVEWPRVVRSANVAVKAGRWLLIGHPTPEFVAAMTARDQSITMSDHVISGEWRGVIFFAGGGTTDDLALAFLRCTQSPLSAPLWLVTRGAVAINASNSQSLRLEHAPLCGMAKVFALEHADQWGAAIDISIQPDAAEWAALADELLAATRDDDQVALRGSDRHVARLVRTTITPVSPVEVRADRLYWITGGTGALGLHVARSLVARGARRLLLTARRAPAESATAAIEVLRCSGVAVRFVALDVANASEVRSLAQEVAGSLRGIVHAAGVVSDMPLATMTPSALRDVLSPKADGAAALHAATRDLKLDFFVLFSSIASVWGAKGQAHYAAANAALDALAHHRRASGLPALSVNWGPWAGGGMAGDAEQAVLKRFGIAALDPAVALEQLGVALAGGVAQITIAQIDWHRFREFFELRGPKPFLSLVGPRRNSAASANGERSSAVVTLAAAAPGERLEQLRSFLQAEVAAALGFKAGRRPDPRQGFFELGMDSMIAVDLRNRLARAFAHELPTTLLFDHANIRLLADYLAAHVLGWDRGSPDNSTAAHAARPPAMLPSVTPGNSPITVAASDETDLDAALTRRLEKLEALIRDT